MRIADRGPGHLPPLIPRRAVFLDRDGVINRVILRGGSPYPPRSTDDLEILPGVPEAVEALRGAGYLVVVSTNQPDVAAGIQGRAVVEAIHERVRSLVAVDEIRVCYHDDRDGCACRKPRPGMLLEAAVAWSLDLGRSYMVGDRWRDVRAGCAAGCRTILVGTGYGEPLRAAPDAAVGSLLEASALILAGQV